MMATISKMAAKYIYISIFLVKCEFNNIVLSRDCYKSVTVCFETSMGGYLGSHNLQIQCKIYSRWLMTQGLRMTTIHRIIHRGGGGSDGGYLLKKGNGILRISTERVLIRFYQMNPHNFDQRCDEAPIGPYIQ